LELYEGKQKFGKGGSKRGDQGGNNLRFVWGGKELSEPTEGVVKGVRKGGWPGQRFNEPMSV